jgi:hypothetical protein
MGAEVLIPRRVVGPSLSSATRSALPFDDPIDDLTGRKEFVLAVRVTRRCATDIAVESLRLERVLQLLLVVVLVVSKYDNVGVNPFDRDEDIFRVTEVSLVNDAESVDHISALPTGQDGLFLVCDVLTPSHDDVKSITHRSGVGEIVDVTRMKDVEGALCDDISHE